MKVPRFVLFDSPDADMCLNIYQTPPEHSFPVSRKVLNTFSFLPFLLPVKQTTTSCQANASKNFSVHRAYNYILALQDAKACTCPMFNI